MQCNDLHFRAAAFMRTNYAMKMKIKGKINEIKINAHITLPHDGVER